MKNINKAIAKEIGKSKPQHTANVLEEGHIYFFYSPKVEEKVVESMDDVQRLYMILHPFERHMYRLIVLARKQLPEIKDDEKNIWGFVERAETDAKAITKKLKGKIYETKTRGKRFQPPARPAGEGVYVILKHRKHTNLAYVLELPEAPKQVQDALNIEKKASYVLAVKNPQIPSSEEEGLEEEKQAQFPPHLQDIFDEKRWINADPPLFLDYENAELVLIGNTENISKALGVDIEPEKETKATAEVFNDLKIKKEENPVEPLFEGEWL